MQEKAATVLRPVGFQLPTSLLRSGYVGNITYRGPKGNISLHVPIKERIHSIHALNLRLPDSLPFHDHFGNIAEDGQMRKNSIMVGQYLLSPPTQLFLFF